MARGDDDLLGDLLARRLGLTGRRRGRRLVKRGDEVSAPLSATKKILLLDPWNRSGLPARDFASLTGLSSAANLDPGFRDAALRMQAFVDK